MSSHEVIKQSRRIMGIIKNGDAKLRHKIGEVFIEIIIIVFAISLSLFLDRWRQNQDDRDLERKFLAGLRIDLGNDLKELKKATEKCNSMKVAADYFSQPAQNINWSSDSVRYYTYKLFHNIYFFPNANRYESVKSTDKLNVIENERLRNDVIDLYQTKIPDLEQQINFFNQFENVEVKDYLIHNLKRDEKNSPIVDKSIFESTEMKNIVSLYSDLDDVMKRLNAA